MHPNNKNMNDLMNNFDEDLNSQQQALLMQQNNKGENVLMIACKNKPTIAIKIINNEQCTPDVLLQQNKNDEKSSSKTKTKISNLSRA